MRFGQQLRAGGAQRPPEGAVAGVPGTLEKLLDLPIVGDVRGDPVIQLSPPLTAGPAEFDEIEQILRGVLTEAWSRL